MNFQGSYRYHHEWYGSDQSLISCNRHESLQNEAITTETYFQEGEGTITNHIVQSIQQSENRSRNRGIRAICTIRDRSVPFTTDKRDIPKCSQVLNLDEWFDGFQRVKNSFLARFRHSTEKLPILLNEVQSLTNNSSNLSRKTPSQCEEQDFRTLQIIERCCCDEFCYIKRSNMQDILMFIKDVTHALQDLEIYYFSSPPPLRLGGHWID